MSCPECLEKQKQIESDWVNSHKAFNREVDLKKKIKHLTSVNVSLAKTRIISDESTEADLVASLHAHIADLQSKNDVLRRELDNCYKKARETNVQLDALGFIWCDGNCRGAYRFSDKELTEEIVSEAERNTQRMRSHYEHTKHRKKP